MPCEIGRRDHVLFQCVLGLTLASVVGCSSVNDSPPDNDSADASTIYFQDTGVYPSADAASTTVDQGAVLLDAGISPDTGASPDQGSQSADLGGQIAPDASLAADAGVPDADLYADCNPVPLYEYWNGTTKDHFYTTNWSTLGDGADGYTYELVAACVCQKQGSGSTPLYRYWNSTIKDHFYTVDWSALGSGANGYSYEGIAGYVYADTGTGRLPFYRYWSSTLKDHYYTTDWSKLLTGNSDYTFEKVETHVLSVEHCQ